MNNLTILYFGIGCIIVLVKCLIILFMNAIKYYLTPKEIFEALITFILDIIAWPIDIIITTKYLIDKEYRNKIISNMKKDRLENDQ